MQMLDQKACPLANLEKMPVGPKLERRVPHPHPYTWQIRAGETREKKPEKKNEKTPCFSIVT